MLFDKELSFCMGDLTGSFADGAFETIASKVADIAEETVFLCAIPAIPEGKDVSQSGRNNIVLHNQSTSRSITGTWATRGEPSRVR